jgi:hypothetical protein
MKPDPTESTCVNPVAKGGGRERAEGPERRLVKREWLQEFTKRGMLVAALSAGMALALASTIARAATTVLTFDGLYKSRGVRGLEFSDSLLASRGQLVGITGFMAPPLKAESTFFVLTAQPMAICPFCASDADWPDDIVVVMLKTAVPMLGGGTRLAVTGTLEVGSRTDSATGFVSQIRLVDASFAPAV